jgi:hypothetical protein
MGISIFKIRKWCKMLMGKSISHVNQGVGRCYSRTEVEGYYNDLTEKVLKDDPNILIPQYYVDTGEKIYFPIGIFQYGLAAYDLFLTTHDEIYKEKIIACANWAVENQQDDGGWNTFSFESPEHPYSSMAQGEGICMLIRAHILTGEEDYLHAVHKAKEFMLKPIYEGGTTDYSGEDIYLYEYTHQPLILNGWIFSLWGLYDYNKYIKDADVQAVLEMTLVSLKKKLPAFDIKYWSKYEDGKRICSPFYHKLHIAQLSVMYDLFGDEIYKEYASKWDLYQKSFWKPKWAFLKKAGQKIFE